MGKRQRRRERMENLPSSDGAIVPTVKNLPNGATKNTPPRAVPRGGVVMSSEMYTGPLPHPDTLRAFEEICPGSAKMIFDKFEQQSDHRVRMESLVITSNVNAASRGQWMAFAVLLSVIGTGGFLAYKGLDAAGFGVIATAVAGAVWVLSKAERAKKQDLAEKRGEKGKRGP